MISKVFKPAVTANGLPDKVPAWYTPPKGEMQAMMSLRPPNAANGMPPPMTLPMVVKSGLMPCKDWAQPKATRKPVITSS